MMKNPWLRAAPDYYPVKEIESVRVEDRFQEIKCFGASKLIEIIRWPGTQKGVRKKARVLLKRMEIDSELLRKT